MTQVLMDAALGGDGQTYTDDGTGKNLNAGGHRTNFLPLMSASVGVAVFVAAQAAAALNAPGTSATSATSLSIGTGSKSLTIQPGKSLVVGMSMKIARTAAPTNWMFGDLTAYDSVTGSLTVNVTNINGGGGPFTDWTVSLSGPRGAGTDPKDSCRVATTSNITLSGTQTIDGVSVVAGDRVLVKNQTAGAENGIYVCAAGAWSRAADAASSAEVTSGLATFVTEGTVGGAGGGTLWVLTTDDPITLGTTTLVFAQIGATPGSVGDHEIVVTTGNGHGSTNTRIRRFTTTQSSVGTAITYADSAANGASFTINETGLYSIYYLDQCNSTGNAKHGVSVNSSQLSTNIDSITAANRLALVGQTAVGDLLVVTRTVKLTAADVVRPHTYGNQDATSVAYTVFSIRKVNTI